MDPVRGAVAVVVLVAVTFAVVAGLRLERPWLQPWAAVRAVVQLGVLSLVLGGVVTDLRWTAAFLLLMVGTACATAHGRLRRLGPSSVPRIAATVLVAATVPVSVVFVSGALPLVPRYLLAMGGIVVGGSMTAATLMGRALFAALADSRGEIEAWLALGATPRQAALEPTRRAASTALVPATDQTRTTGLVTLPGAFVGAVFAGADVVDAAQFQVVVLVAVLCSGALTTLMFAWFFGAPRFLPAATPTT
ncbi:ABC transporter permease [Isoptericola sp. NPDC057653]|uniref:ABC transporter permease n=1 Tax=Isoptericola sp. NPDC057653 TaxID=3346195 RepID=UPI0036C3CD6F